MFLLQINKTSCQHTSSNAWMFAPLSIRRKAILGSLNAAAVCRRLPSCEEYQKHTRIILWVFHGMWCLNPCREYCFALMLTRNKFQHKNCTWKISLLVCIKEAAVTFLRVIKYEKPSENQLASVFHLCCLFGHPKLNIRSHQESSHTNSCKRTCALLRFKTIDVAVLWCRRIFAELDSCLIFLILTCQAYRWASWY